VTWCRNCRTGRDGPARSRPWRSARMAHGWQSAPATARSVCGRSPTTGLLALSRSRTSQRESGERLRRGGISCDRGPVHVLTRFTHPHGTFSSVNDEGGADGGHAPQSRSEGRGRLPGREQRTSTGSRWATGLARTARRRPRPPSWSRSWRRCHRRRPPARECAHRQMPPISPGIPSCTPRRR
jgi:hypothetical protein